MRKKFYAIVMASVFVMTCILGKGEYVKAADLYYTHSVTCNCGETIFASESFEIINPYSICTSVIVRKGELDLSTHTVMYTGRIGKVWADNRLLCQRFETSVNGERMYYYNSNGENFIYNAYARFYIKEGTNSDTIKSWTLYAN